MTVEMLQGRLSYPRKVADRPLQDSGPANNPVNPEDVDHLPMGLTVGVANVLGEHENFQVVFINPKQWNLPAESW